MDEKYIASIDQRTTGTRFIVFTQDGSVAGERASANNFLRQLQADILGIEIVRPRIMETTALGVAYAAGLAIGKIFIATTMSFRKVGNIE